MVFPTAWNSLHQVRITGKPATELEDESIADYVGDREFVWFDDEFDKVDIKHMKYWLNSSGKNN